MFFSPSTLSFSVRVSFCRDELRFLCLSIKNHLSFIHPVLSVSRLTFYKMRQEIHLLETQRKWQCRTEFCMTAMFQKEFHLRMQKRVDFGTVDFSSTIKCNNGRFACWIWIVSLSLSLTKFSSWNKIIHSRSLPKTGKIEWQLWTI